MTPSDEAKLRRQEQIWTNLYGPREAAELVAEATRLLAERPGLSPEEAFRAVDSDDADDYEDFVATRW